MFLYLGEDTLLRAGEALGIFDLDAATLSGKTRDFLARAQRAGRVLNVGEGLPKSFVPAAAPPRRGEKADDFTVYICRPGAATLKKRLGAWEGY